MSGIFSGRDSWIRNFHTAPDAFGRLLCLPHAGGSASFYFRLSQQLAPGVDVLAVQYPGRQDRKDEALLTEIGDLADRITAAVGSPAGVPLAVFGHSMGATVGYEVAQRLEAAGHSLAALVVSARRAPHRNLDAGLHRLPDDELVAQVRSLSPMSAAALDDDELVRMALPAIRADYSASETYRYATRPPLDCGIDAFAGTADPLLPADEMRHWADHTCGSFTFRAFPGGHFYLSDHWPAISRILTGRFAHVGASALEL